MTSGRRVKGSKPQTWRKLRRTLKRSQLRQARKEAERARKRGGRIKKARDRPW